MMCNICNTLHDQNTQHWKISQGYNKNILQHKNGIQWKINAETDHWKWEELIKAEQGSNNHRFSTHYFRIPRTQKSCITLEAIMEDLHRVHNASKRRQFQHLLHRLQYFILLNDTQAGEWWFSRSDSTLVCEYDHEVKYIDIPNELKSIAENAQQSPIPCCPDRQAGKNRNFIKLNIPISSHEKIARIQELKHKMCENFMSPRNHVISI